MLMNVESGEPERNIWLELGREALLGHVVTALHVQVVQRVQVFLSERRGRYRNECYAEQAAQFMGSGSSSYLLFPPKVRNKMRFYQLFSADVVRFPGKSSIEIFHCSAFAFVALVDVTTSNT